jgi:hypothetical protein
MTFAAVGVGVAEAAFATAAAAEAGTLASATALAISAAETFSTSAILQGLSLAWSIGSTISSFFQGSNQSLNGPRLKDAHVQSAAFGTPMKRFWGIDRMAGELVWVGSDGKGGRGIRESKHHLSGGKGKGGSAGVFYTYAADFAISVNAASRCKGVIRIWAGAKLIYDVSADATLQGLVGTGQNLNDQDGSVTFYDGNENQQPPALIEALAGAGNTSAYRNQFLAVFSNFDTTQYGTIPSFSFECYTDGDDEYQEKMYYDTQQKAASDAGARISWSYVSQSGEIDVLIGNNNTDFTSIQGPINTREPGQPVWRMFHLTPDGAITREDLATSWPSEFPPGNATATGVSDEPMMINSFNGINVVSIIRPGQATLQITGGDAVPPGSGTFAYMFFAKKGDRLWIGNDGNWVRGLTVFNFPGCAALHWWSETYSAFVMNTYGLSMGFQKGDDFLWYLTWGNSPITGNSQLLVKLDPDTLEVVGYVDLGVNNLSSFFVENDSNIFFIGDGSFGHVAFYKWNGTTLDALGEADALHGNPGGNLFVRNNIWYQGSSGAWGSFDIALRVYGPGVEARCCPLWKIVRDICLACGLEEPDIDVSELTDCVQGYTIDQQMTGRDAILPLQRYAFFDGRESDLVLEFPKRGRPPVDVIPEDDLAARPGLDAQLPDAITTTRGQETELPMTVHVRFKDQDASYQTGHAYSARLTSESKNVLIVDVPIVMTADKAKQISYVLMAQNWLERAPKEIQVSRRYLPLDAADPIDIEVAA